MLLTNLPIRDWITTSTNKNHDNYSVWTFICLTLTQPVDGKQMLYILLIVFVVMIVTFLSSIVQTLVLFVLLSSQLNKNWQRINAAKSFACYVRKIILPWNEWDDRIGLGQFTVTQ